MNVVGVADGIATGLLYFTAAAGLSLILGALRVLTLAHGSAYLAGTWLAWHLSADASLTGYAMAIAAAIPAGVLLGGLGAAVTWPLRRQGHLRQALATLGLSLILAQAFAAATGGRWLPAVAPRPLHGTTDVLGSSYPTWRLVFIGTAAVIATVMWWTVTGTRTGAVTRAVADDPQMAACMGIRPATVHTTVFMAGTTLTVAAGVLAAPILPGGPAIDEHLLVMSLIIVVLGGTDLRGALAAALVAGQVDTVGRTIAPAFAPFLLFAVLIGVIAVRPRGLTGTLS